MGDLKKRILSAVSFGPLIVLLFLFLPPKFFFLFMGLVLIMAVYEFSSMARVANVYTVTLLAVLGLIPLYAGSPNVYLLWLLLSVVLYLLFKMVRPPRGDVSINREIGLGLVVLLLSQIFLALPLFFLYRLKQLDPYLPLILLLTIWASDTGAYMIGKTLGRHKLAPLISPKKTYEGLFGAMLGAVVLTLLFHGKMGIGIWPSLGIGVLIGVLGQLGDILESIAKRVCEVKDSSTLIPGHGGILDRIDSFLFTAPFMYHYLTGFTR